MFVTKYAPKTLSEFVGNKELVEAAKQWLMSWPKQGRALFLLGPAGIGKTTLATLLAKENNLELFEVNASDTRNKNTIIHQVAPATLDQSLFGSRRLVLIDEVDGMAGNQDRGGLLTLSNVILKTKQPIILTANDVESDKIHQLYKKCNKNCTKLILNLPTKEKVKERLKTICEKEGIQASDNILLRIAEICQCDIRNSINMLELIGSGKKTIKEKDLELVTGKDILLEEKDVLFRVLKTKRLSIALNALFDTDIYPTDLIPWFEENLPYIYKDPADLARAYLWLAEADKYAAQIKKQKWIYLTNVAQSLASISVAKTNPVNLTPEDKFRQPLIGLMIWRARQQQQEINEFCEKKAQELHMSFHKIKEKYWMYKEIAAKID